MHSWSLCFSHCHVLFSHFPRQCVFSAKISPMSSEYSCPFSEVLYVRNAKADRITHQQYRMLSVIGGLPYTLLLQCDAKHLQFTGQRKHCLHCKRCFRASAEITITTVTKLRWIGRCHIPAYLSRQIATQRAVRKCNSQLSDIDLDLDPVPVPDTHVYNLLRASCECIIHIVECHVELPRNDHIKTPVSSPQSLVRLGNAFSFFGMDTVLRILSCAWISHSVEWQLLPRRPTKKEYYQAPCNISFRACEGHISCHSQRLNLPPRHDVECWVIKPATWVNAAHGSLRVVRLSHLMSTIRSIPSFRTGSSRATELSSHRRGEGETRGLLLISAFIHTQEGVYLRA